MQELFERSFWMRSRSMLKAVQKARISHLTLAEILGIAIIFLLALCGLPEKNRNRLAAGVAPGVVTLDVLQGGLPWHYWKYQVRPTDGSVRVIEQRTFADPEHYDISYTAKQDTGAVYGCAQNPQATSPDNKYIAQCKGEKWEFEVEDIASSTVVFRWVSRPHLESRSIWGFAWAPNSKSLAVLNATGHLGLMPRDLLAFASGHPVSHDTIYLDFIDIATGRRTEFVIRRDVISPQIVRVLDWSE